MFSGQPFAGEQWNDPRRHQQLLVHLGCRRLALHGHAAPVRPDQRELLHRLRRLPALGGEGLLVLDLLRPDRLVDVGHPDPGHELRRLHTDGDHVARRLGRLDGHPAGRPDLDADPRRRPVRLHRQRSRRDQPERRCAEAGREASGRRPTPCLSSEARCRSTAPTARRPVNASVTVSSLGTASSSTAANVATIEFTGVPVEAELWTITIDGILFVQVSHSTNTLNEVLTGLGASITSTLTGTQPSPTSRPAAYRLRVTHTGAASIAATTSVLLDTHETQGGADVTASGADARSISPPARLARTRRGRSRSTASRTRMSSRPAARPRRRSRPRSGVLVPSGTYTVGGTGTLVTLHRVDGTTVAAHARPSRRSAAPPRPPPGRRSRSSLTGEPHAGRDLDAQARQRVVLLRRRLRRRRSPTSRPVSACCCRSALYNVSVLGRVITITSATDEPDRHRAALDLARQPGRRRRDPAARLRRDELGHAADRHRPGASTTTSSTAATRSSSRR